MIYIYAPRIENQPNDSDHHSYEAANTVTKKAP